MVQVHPCTRASQAPSGFLVGRPPQMHSLVGNKDSFIRHMLSKASTHWAASGWGSLQQNPKCCNGPLCVHEPSQCAGPLCLEVHAPVCLLHCRPPTVLSGERSVFRKSFSGKYMSARCSASLSPSHGRVWPLRSTPSRANGISFPQGGTLSFGPH